MEYASLLSFSLPLLFIDWLIRENRIYCSIHLIPGLEDLGLKRRSHSLPCLITGPLCCLQEATLAQLAPVVLFGVPLCFPQSLTEGQFFVLGPSLTSPRSAYQPKQSVYEHAKTLTARSTTIPYYNFVSDSDTAQTHSRSTEKPKARGWTIWVCPLLPSSSSVTPVSSGAPAPDRGPFIHFCDSRH